MKPTTNDIARVLESIETAELPDEHPRQLAKRAIAKWRSDAQKQRLPVTNQHDRGGKRLNVDEVINSSLPNHTRK